MKLFTALAALTLIAAPANAQLNHTGRYYGPNGTYVKCDTIGSYTNNSTYCKSGEEAREDDRRHESKNDCLKRIQAAWDANNQEVFQEVEQQLAIKFPSQVGPAYKAINDLSIKAEVAIIRSNDPAVKASNSKCFAKNGF